MRSGYGETLVLQGCGEVQVTIAALELESHPALAEEVADLHAHHHASGNLIVDTDPGFTILESLSRTAMYRMFSELSDSSRLRLRDYFPWSMHRYRDGLVTPAVKALGSYEIVEGDVFVPRFETVFTVCREVMDAVKQTLDKAN